MDYRGSIINLSRYEGLVPKDYICTAHYAGCVEVVPVEIGQENITYPPIQLVGPGLVGTVHGWRLDPATIAQVTKRCEARIADLEAKVYPLSEGQVSQQKGLQCNLGRLKGLDGDLPAKRAEPKPSDYSSAQNAVFAGIYGVPVRPNYVGKLVFVEIPLEFDDDSSGEFIVVAQSADSLYVVDTASCMDGIRVYRMPFSSGTVSINILNSYEDDDFVREFIDRLDDMDTEDYDTLACDAAETVSRQLNRMLEAKANKIDLLDRMFSGMIFGPLYGLGKTSSVCPTDARQAEDRCHRGCCV
jgi:hypothetical protein